MYVPSPDLTSERDVHNLSDTNPVPASAMMAMVLSMVHSNFCPIKFQW